MHIARYGRCIAQAAGLQVRLAAGARLVAAQRAIDAQHRQRRQEFGHHRRAPGDLQHARQALGRDALLATQARAVFHDGQGLGADSALPPLAQRHLRAVPAAHTITLAAHGQENLLSHDVVAIFIDIPDHLGKRFRLDHHGGFQPLRHAAVAHRAAELAAEFPPHAFDRARRELRAVDRGHGPVARTARGRVAAGEIHAPGELQAGLQPQMPIAARRTFGRERHAGLQRHAGQRRVVLDACQPPLHIRKKTHHQRLVVDQQRIGRHVVGAQRLAIEQCRGVRGQRKRRAVQHDIAIDGAHAQGLQPAQRQPQPLHHQPRIALALDIERAAQHAGLHGPAKVERRAPGIGRAQLVERRKGGHELHHRCRIHGPFGLPGQARRRASGSFGIHHQHRQRVGRQLGTRQRGRDRGRQGRLGLGGAPQHQRQGNTKHRARAMRSAQARQNGLQRHADQFRACHVPCWRRALAARRARSAAGTDNQGLAQLRVPAHALPLSTAPP